MKTKNRQVGIELIAKERTEQIEKHGYTMYEDKTKYEPNVLRGAAIKILNKDGVPPYGWDERIWNKMIVKSNKERIIIAGAFLCAELDIMNYELDTTTGLD